jgi:hypothetical protein
LEADVFSAELLLLEPKSADDNAQAEYEEDVADYCARNRRLY